MIFCVRNNGDLGANSVVGTLLNTGGVTGASGPQTYGAMAPGAIVCASFTFTASGSCGGMITASIQLQDGAANLGTVTYHFTLGRAKRDHRFHTEFRRGDGSGPAGGMDDSRHWRGIAVGNFDDDSEQRAE